MTAAGTAIPAQLDQVTADWLTGVFRASGAIQPENSVTGCDLEPLGEGEGFLGELARVRLSYAAPAPAAPETVIAKFPSRIPENKALGVMFAGYEKEIRFYEELARECSVRTPRCYYGAFDPPKTSDTVATKILRWLPNRVTLSLLDTLMKQAGKTGRRYGLMIEDLGNARVGDQVRGCSAQDAEVALLALARVHARFWESPLLDRDWITPADDQPAVVHGLYRRAWPIFEARFRDRFTPEAERINAWIDANGVDLLKRTGRPRTLNHGDYRLDNIMFDDHDPERAVTIIDWQAVTSGNPMTDVAYFLRPNMSPEEADAHEDRLIALYHEELVANGVSNYSLDQCRSDYVMGQLWVWHRGAILIGSLDLSHERGVALVDMAIGRALRAASRIDPDAVDL